MTPDMMTWADTNQRYLVTALAEVRFALEQHAFRLEGRPTPPETPIPTQGIVDQTGAPPALDSLVATLGLSTFERAILILCAGVELDSAIAGLCASAQGDPTQRFPTFSLALAALEAPHWSALTPSAPLRRWRLVEITSQPGSSLTTSPLRIDERILHYLAGIQHLDERLVGLIEQTPLAQGLVPSHQALADRIASAWSAADGQWPIIQVNGADEVARRAVASVACANVGLHLSALAADLIPTSAGESEGLLRLWDREAVLTGSALYVDAEGVDQADGRVTATVGRSLERLTGPVILSARDRWRPLRRPMVTFEVGQPTANEQREIWRGALGNAAARLNGHVDRLVAQFRLPGPAIQASVRDALTTTDSDESLAENLWNAGRAQARPRLDDAAQRIEPAATWDDLVLPDAERHLLAEIASQVAHRTTVYDTWGFGSRGGRGLGISALFSGSSGTGKTLAAEVLAHTLRLDLYRIDLSSVVNKYIGETEKNLRRVFDAAEDGGAILFFDEADALFGKRSEVKDSHDRYANIEVNYLLQRMESYRGLAVLATNLKGSLDPAFLRRIRFVVNFPFPDATLRAEIWRRVFPLATPTESLDVMKLARLNLTGGNIRNIALNAAFLAAAEGEPVTMSHLSRATRAEYAKLDKPLSDAEIASWA